MFKFFHQRRGIEECEVRYVALDEISQSVENIHVLFDNLPDARTSHLEDNLLAAPQRRPMHLGDRGRSQGGILEFGDQFPQRGLQFRLDNLPRLLAREGGHLVQKRIECLYVLTGDDIGPGREDLAKLNKTRAQLL